MALSNSCFISVSVTGVYTVVPQYKGKYKIPSTGFSYFNPQTKKYESINTEDLYVDVTEGKELPVNTTKSIEKKAVVLTGKNFRYIQTQSDFVSAETDEFYKTNLFYALLFLPFLIIPIGIVIAKNSEKRNSDVVGLKLRKAEKLAKKYLSEAQKQLGKKEAFYEALGYKIESVTPDLCLCENDTMVFFLQRFYNKELAENLMFQLIVDDIEQAYASSKEAGKQTKLSEISEETWGKVFYLWGPAGELWHVTELL